MLFNLFLLARSDESKAISHDIVNPPSILEDEEFETNSENNGKNMFHS